MRLIPLTSLAPHPLNPRLVANEEVIEQIAAQLNGHMDEAYALLVRPTGDGFQILAGHHRALAATRRGLTEVPCHVREMGDADAYMTLVLANAQSELSELEVGLHALRSGISGSEYARRTVMSEGALRDRIMAARVAESSSLHMQGLADQWRAMAALHVAPRWLWRALVTRLVEDGWTVEQARTHAARVKDAAEPPTWANAEEVALLVAAGATRPSTGKELADDAEQARQSIRQNAVEVDAYLAQLDAALAAAAPSKRSEVAAAASPVIADQEQEVARRRAEETAKLRDEEQRAQRISRLRQFCSLDEWKQLTTAEHADLLTFAASAGDSKFNKQESADIEWAQWSWNPITGCLHACPYCYARDISQSKRMEKVYPNGFAPTLVPSRVASPLTQHPPKEAATDARFRNVFTCSMADMFGRWVPAEWIEAVLASMRAAPDWNFLCLTKFPKRMSEFDTPPNTWLGTSVDMQARVAAAEAGFANVSAAVKWLSVEPMLEPLRFKRLDLFDWVVIGGASSSSKTPEWHPPIAWVMDLVAQAKDAGCAVYMKSNLLDTKTARILELPVGLPVTPDSVELPEAFNYLGKGKSTDQMVEVAT